MENYMSLEELCAFVKKAEWCRKHNVTIPWSDYQKALENLAAMRCCEEIDFFLDCDKSIITAYNADERESVGEWGGLDELWPEFIAALKNEICGTAVMHHG